MEEGEGGRGSALTAPDTLGRSYTPCLSHPLTCSLPPSRPPSLLLSLSSFLAPPTTLPPTPQPTQPPVDCMPHKEQARGTHLLRSGSALSALRCSVLRRGLVLQTITAPASYAKAARRGVAIRQWFSPSTRNCCQSSGHCSVKEVKCVVDCRGGNVGGSAEAGVGPSQWERKDLKNGIGSLCPCHPFGFHRAHRKEGANARSRKTADPQVARAQAPAPADQTPLRRGLKTKSTGQH